MWLRNKRTAIVRICQIISRLAATPEGVLVGGPPNTMLKLAKRQQALGHHVSILAGCPSREAIANAKNAFAPITIRPIPINGRFAGPLRGIEFIAKGIAHSLRHRKEMKTLDVLHSHSGYHHLAALTSAISKSLGVPAIHTLYCPITNEIEERRSWLLSLKTANISLKGIARIVAISKNIERSLINAGIDQSKIRVIPPGIDTEAFHPGVSGQEWRKKLGVPNDGKLIFYLGNLLKAKGLDVLIEALRTIVAQSPKVCFAYALQKQHRSFEQRRQECRDALKEISLYAPAREFGSVPRIQELMAAADVFVSPVRTTNGLADYPISIMEAMALEKPVVSTPVGGVKEIVVHETHGLLATPGDPEDLAAQILRSLNSPEMAKELGANARKQIADNFSMGAFVERTMRLYEELT